MLTKKLPGLIGLAASSLFILTVAVFAEAPRDTHSAPAATIMAGR
jgi:hypothetical protein